MSQESTKWYHTLLTPQTVIYIIGGIVAIVIFWNKTKETWGEVKNIKTELLLKADKSELRSVDDKVNKQYATINEIRTMVTLVEKWIEYHKGYEQARKDYNVKP